MQYYTTQQLQGHTTFKPHVRIGNWNEDIELLNEKQKEFIRAKEEGLLPHQIMERKMKHHLSPIPLTEKRENGAIHFGDIVMIKSVNTEGILCMDLDTILHHVNDRFACTTSTLTTTPCARNCFIVEKVPNDTSADMIIPEEESHILHYGQKFRLKCVPQFHSPIYLRSEKPSPTCFASGTSSAEKCQEVSVDQVVNYETVWKVQYLHKGYRLEYEGQMVNVNEPIILTHCATNQCLSSNKSIVMLNDFGKEYQVFCKTSLTIHKTEDVCNHFMILQAENQ
ncbi:hypothetical protein FDP41_005186 [Naegleria fowleri]|uniref:Uncharacterized protein n=1 Tax=Naegleria fowleri TaxID=5763 RepID=A0A6A5BSI7_NAEFO|nr:uncharacterized protein FDP41_005186 [Naegleria fowleri]KAF0975859.1 hypothetical protein FDP41_005186 [Naegleria fowleri]CAG4709059.1 unnamed protein product [Naegleria fowleri]